MMTHDENREAAVWAMRATAWELLALTFRYPDRQLVDAVESGEWADAAVEIASALGLPADASELARALPADGASGEAFLHDLRAEATRLFVGAPLPACAPFEGIWRAHDEGVQPLLFVNPHSMDVERFCRSCGLGHAEGTNEPLDHVSAECELLQYFASLSAGIAAPVATSPELAELPGGSPQGAYALFLDEHALTWMPRFAKSVADQAKQPVYRAGALLLAALLEAHAGESAADRRDPSDASAD